MTSHARASTASALAILLVGGLSVAATGTAHAQNCPSGKTCFYVPPQMPPPEHPVTWDLVLASASGVVTGSYTIAGQGTQSFVATAGTPVTVALSTSGGVASAYATAESRGVFVVADAPGLSVVAREITGPWNSSASIKDHNIALGTRFRVGGYTLDHPGSVPAKSGHDVVILYAPLGATVTVTPPVGVLWGDSLPAGPQTITLAPQQTYLLRTRAAACGYDLTGALVTADAPISVVSGGRGWGQASPICSAPGDPSPATACGDDGLDNLIPASGLGTVYAVDAYPGKGGDRVAVVADTDGTEVRVNGALVATLASGGVHYVFNESLVLIETSAPAYVYQNAGQESCEQGLSIIPPLNFSGGAASQVVAFNVFGDGRVSVFIPTAQAATVRLDGAAPAGASSALVPGRPDVTLVRFPISGGNHAVSATGDFQVGLVSQSLAAGGTGLFAYYNRFRVPGCGDGIDDPGEVCDDGNVEDGDGCSGACRIEIGWGPCSTDGDCVANGRCDLDTGLCVARCNDDADCDDSNGCTTDACNLETGSCQSTAVAPGTDCDDGDFCTANTVCDAQAVCGGGDTISCAPAADVCDEAVCDEATNQCVERARSCDLERVYFFGVVRIGGPDGELGSVRCWREDGLVQCDMNGDELAVGGPVCE